MWHLATNNLAGRPGRTALLVTAVTLATVLSVLVAVTIGTLQHSYTEAMKSAAGAGDLHIRHRSHQRFDANLLEQVRTFPEVEFAAGRLEQRGVNLELSRTKRNVIVVIHGVEPQYDRLFFPVKLIGGRYVEKDDEAVIDGRVMAALDAKVGDELQIEWQETRLKVVGVSEQPPLTVLQLPGVITTLATAQKIAGYPDKLRKIEIKLKEPVERKSSAMTSPHSPPFQGGAGGGLRPRTTTRASFIDGPTLPRPLPEREGSHHDAHIHAFIKQHEWKLPRDTLFEPPANVRAGINRGVKWTNLIGQIVTVLVCLSTAFIIVTGLTTAVTERTRELAIMRCVGTPRLHIGFSQVATGGFIAAMGAIIGTPLGVALAYFIYTKNREILSAGFVFNLPGIIQANLATIIAGLLGALYPAFMATRVRPLEALAARARQPRFWGVVVCLVLGLAGVLFEPMVLLMLEDTEQAFWIYLPWGLGATFFGYCLICVAVLVFLAPLLTSLIAKTLRIPRVLLHETVMATPFRHGLTAGALMMGLAMLVAIWTEGGNLLYGWFNTIKMPDAFIMASDGVTPKMMEIVRSEKDITAICGVTAKPVQTRSVSFGVQTITPPYTLFAASNIPEFLEMTDIEWLAGDKESALKRIARGNAVLVGREYLVAHGMGVGAKITLKTDTRGDREFEIAGVVGAVGLDVAVAHFGIGQEYAEASVSTVFGTFEDGETYFNIKGPDIILMSLAKDADDVALLENLRQKLSPLTRGELRADSSRIIRKKIQAISIQLMTVASSLALSSLLIASFGVANLIVAEINARRFEYGVIRAIGGHKGMLGRLIAGQTLVIALVACLVGTALGVQIALVGKVFHRRLVGMTYSWLLPWDVVLWGGAIVIIMALGAAAPAIWRLMRKQPTALLAADA